MTRRVLMVDDEELILKVVEVSLTKVGGWEVVTAGSGEEGLRKAMAEQPDAILLDVMMPGLDGPGTFERLRADPATADIPVVFFTATARVSDHRRWSDLGLAGIVVKPFDPRLLASQLAEILGWDP